MEEVRPVARGGRMARMHSGGKGKSGSTKPDSKAPPSWSNSDKKEVEIAYLGLLEEYHNQKLGSFLLSSAIRNSFKEKTNRVWVHTCSLDHKNALKNYLSRGMKIFKKETISI